MFTSPLLPLQRFVVYIFNIAYVSWDHKGKLRDAHFQHDQIYD